MMSSRPGVFVQAYNAQMAVDADSHVIVAAAVTQQEHDRQQLVPMSEAVHRSTGRKPKIITADAGYWKSEAFKHQALERIRVLVPPDGGRTRTLHPNSPQTEAARRMRKALSRPSGRMTYARGKGCVEPVFGTLKEHRGYRRFLLRGKDKVNGEWQLICAAHNLRKLCAHRSGQPS